MHLNILQQIYNLNFYRSVDYNEGYERQEIKEKVSSRNCQGDEAKGQEARSPQANRGARGEIFINDQY